MLVRDKGMSLESGLTDAMRIEPPQFSKLSPVLRLRCGLSIDVPGGGLFDFKPFFA